MGSEEDEIKSKQASKKVRTLLDIIDLNTFPFNIRLENFENKL